MMCDDYLPLIDELVEGELDEEMTERVQLYAFSCPECVSYYETLVKEKQVYGSYLYDIEPPVNLAQKFQARLKAEKEQIAQAAIAPVEKVSLWSKLFGSWRLYPALAFAGLIAIFGLGFIFLSSFIKKESQNDNLAGWKTTDRKTERTIEKVSDTAIDPSQGQNTDKLKSFEASEDKNLTASIKESTAKRIAPVKATNASIRTTTANNAAFKKDVSSEQYKLSEEDQLQILRLKNLETETAKQLEKVELLLRAFRNARSIDGGDVYDISYEKEQARRLLEKNVLLRQSAESYGTFYSEELLSRLEPVLLDIANLDSKTSVQKVTDIKERLKTQSLIASLQASR